MLVNPDLRRQDIRESDIIPAGSEVCIVPEVCTEADKDTR
jgi:hypothetical protein